MATRRVRITITAPEIVATLLADSLMKSSRVLIQPDEVFSGYLVDVEEALLLGSE